MDVLRIAAFSDCETGGNPAGVWIGDALPDAAPDKGQEKKVEDDAIVKKALELLAKG